MPSISRHQVEEYSTGTGYSCWDAEWAGNMVSLERVTAPVDAVDKFAALPGGGCQCPHWGYVISGRSTYVFADHEETYEAGDFFYLEPGHRPRHESGTEWVCFSPADLHRATQSLSRVKRQ